MSVRLFVHEKSERKAPFIPISFFYLHSTTDYGQCCFGVVCVFNVACYFFVCSLSLCSQSFFLTNDLTHLGHPFPTLGCDFLLSLSISFFSLFHFTSDFYLCGMKWSLYFHWYFWSFVYANVGSFFFQVFFFRYHFVISPMELS